jgi:hypothetical protein
MIPERRHRSDAASYGVFMSLHSRGDGLADGWLSVGCGLGDVCDNPRAPIHALPIQVGA